MSASIGAAAQAVLDQKRDDQLQRQSELMVLDVLPHLLAPPGAADAVSQVGVQPRQRVDESRPGSVRLAITCHRVTSDSSACSSDSR